MAVLTMYSGIEKDIEDLLKDLVSKRREGFDYLLVSKYVNPEGVVLIDPDIHLATLYDYSTSPGYKLQLDKYHITLSKIVIPNHDLDMWCGHIFKEYLVDNREGVEPICIGSGSYRNLLDVFEDLNLWIDNTFKKKITAKETNLPKFVRVK